MVNTLLKFCLEALTVQTVFIHNLQDLTGPPLGSMAVYVGIFVSKQPHLEYIRKFLNSKFCLCLAPHNQDMKFQVIETHNKAMFTKS